MECIDCNNKISKASTRCKSCSNKFRKGKYKYHTSQRNEKHARWKGYKVGYKQLHFWIRKNKPKPKFCEECKLKEPYDVANISGEYKRDINDYRWLCRNCHQKQDNIHKRGKNHWNWQGGKTKCVNCGKNVTNYTAQRCWECYNNWRIENGKSKRL